jgi:hypothetical protein
LKIWSLLILFSLCALASAASGQDGCPQFSGVAKGRLERQARWLVSDSLQSQIAAKSGAFGKLIAFERCNILRSNLLSDQVTEEEGPFFVADDVALKSGIGRYGQTWMMVIAPAETSGKMPDVNAMKITSNHWTLLNRDKAGTTRILVEGVY